ncbi:hypothetical protein UFOVP45_35 [uncultured Caudovirales phage]|uniref:Uncharacterized protein n=1 Tax=uncultured Caudovirales phage TaxID=2100421 RepID=A0A6J5KUK4_9CAUD|nr:hypothetical protein UFOVP45_35 [uncultured Caudovirales phage]
MAVTKIEPQPLPNNGKGGFINKMATKNTALHKAEWEALEAKHEVERQKLKEKQKSASTTTHKKGN